MGKNSNIGWTDDTWNPAIGCHKVSPGCKYCYMMREMGGVHKMDVDGNVKRTTDKTFYKPLTWQAQGIKAPDGRKRKVFTSSLTDIFHEDIDSFRHEIWKIIRSCPDLIFQILTKRTERIAECLPEDWGEGYDNVWLGCSVENQAMADKRIPELYDVPARTKFLSIEPLIGPVILRDVQKIAQIHSHSVGDYEVNMELFTQTDYSPDGEPSGWDYENYAGIDWVIIGGESGNKTGKWRYRECEIEWIESLIHECDELMIPIFMKQLGTHLANQLGTKHRHGADLTDTAIPTYLNRQHFPESY